MAVDLKFDLVDAGVVAAGGEIADELAFGECDGSGGGKGEGGPLEDLGRGVAGGFDVVHDVVDDEGLRGGGGGGERGGEGERIAELDTAGGGDEGGGDEAGGGGGAVEGKGAGVALFNEGAGAVAHNPGGAGVGAVPGFGAVEDGGGVVFGDVVEVVGDGFAHVERGVGAQSIEDGGGGGGIGDEGGEALAPGQARAGTFGGEAADVFIGVAGPWEHRGKGAGKILREEGAHGEFGGAVAGEMTEGGEGKGRVVQAAEGDEIAGPDADEVVGDERGEAVEDGDFGAEVAGEGGVEGEAGLAQARHEFAGVEVGEGEAEEGGGVEGRGEGGELVGGGAVAGGVEQVFHGRDIAEKRRQRREKRKTGSGKRSNPRKRF